MSTTVTLSCTSSAWCPKNNPSTNYHGNSTYTLAGNGEAPYYTYLLCNFTELSSTYRYRPVISATYHLTIARSIPSSSYTGLVSFRPLSSRFDASSVTYNTVPATAATTLYNGAMTSVGTGDESLSYTARTQDDDYKTAAISALTSCSAKIYLTTSMGSSGYVNAYTEAATSSKRPYLEVVLGDSAATVTPSVTSPGTSTRLNRSSAITFSYTLNASAPAVAPIVQTSATLYWRVKGSTSSYSSVTASGDVRSITVPANTFPGKDIEYYITPVLTGYTAASSATRTAMVRVVADVNPNGLAGIYSASPDENYPWNGRQQLSWSSMAGTRRNLLAEFEGFPAASKYKAVDQAGISVKTGTDALTYRSVQLYFLTSNFDASSVTWNTCPGYGGIRGTRTYSNTTDSYSTNSSFLIQASYFDGLVAPKTDRERSRLAVDTLNNPGFMLAANIGSDPNDLHVFYFYVNDPVVLRAYLIDQTVTSKPEAVNNDSGYVNPHVAQTFRWQHVPNGDYWCVGTWTTASATFYYRASGASSWTSVAATAGSSEVTLAANTMSAGTYEWKVTATDSQGTTATSDVYTINTQDGTHVATPISPNGSLENADAAIRFIWSDASETGAAPGGADLQYSTDDGATWTTFGQPRTSSTQYDAAAGTFPSGPVSWRVRSRNAENTAGSWSSPLSFLCFAAPDPPIVNADGKPLLTVTWQSAEQQAYEITVDGTSYGPYFGTAKTWQVPEYLSNGQHSVSVRVENEYGLWSSPGTKMVTVTNVPGAAITLKGIFERDAELYWTSSSPNNYLIYRDDVLIGHTSSKQFTDRTCLGFHAWKVVQKLSNGYYTVSNTVNGELSVSVPTIKAIDGSGWLELVKSDNSDRSMVWNNSQNVSLRQFAGLEYPSVEVAPYKTESVSFDVAWTRAEADQAAIFAQLIGKTVILKTPNEGTMVGILSAWQRNNTCFYRSYSVTVNRIHWRDYTDADS